jgi:hypothetical protein
MPKSLAAIHHFNREAHPAWPQAIPPPRPLFSWKKSPAITQSHHRCEGGGMRTQPRGHGFERRNRSQRFIISIAKRIPHGRRQSRRPDH